MIAVWSLLLFSLCQSVLARKTNVDPEHLDKLREEGRHEEFAKLLGIEDVNLVHPIEGRTEEDLMFTNVSSLGDILFTQEQEEQSRLGINFIRYSANKWQDHVIPYVIGSGEFTWYQRYTIQSALESLNKEMKNVDIVPRTNQQDYVYIMNGKGCYSHLGRTGGQQPLSLQSSGCLRKGTIMHEMMHAMGMMHEQCRSDRDEYVDVLFENIPEDWHSQYRKVSNKDFDLLGPYDPSSVMHYPMQAPNGKLAFKFHDQSIDTSKVGQRVKPSEIDKKKGDALYSDTKRSIKAYFEVTQN